jgi:hypothetical protein
MKHTHKSKWKNITLRSLKAELRRLPGVDAHETFKEKLLAATLANYPDQDQTDRIKPHPVTWDFGATAAALLIAALILMANYGLSSPSQVLFSQLKDTSLCYPTYDQNSFLCDQNNTYVSSVLPWEIFKENRSK